MKIGRFAPYYRAVEYCAFGRSLERRRFAFLDRVAGATRILILGEGDGRVLSRVLTIAPQAQIDVIEISREMISLARRRTGFSNRIRIRRQDARTADLPAGCYDAVLTMFFLDCFPEHEARQLIQRIAASLRPEAVWLISEFAIPDGGWRRWHARIWIGTMYLFFRAATALRVRSLPPIGKLLAEAGMHVVERETARNGLMTSEVYVSAQNSIRHRN